MANASTNTTITARDLILYVGLPCAIYELDEDGTINRDMNMGSHYIEGVDVTANRVIAGRVNYDPQQIKPILKRLDDLTIDDTVFIVCDIMEYDRPANKVERKRWHDTHLKQIREYGFIQFETSESIFTPKIIEYLIRKGYNFHLLPHGTYLLQNKNGRVTEE